jgi:hypothetical protein
VTTTPDAVKTEFNRDRDQPQVAQLLRAGCTHDQGVLDMAAVRGGAADFDGGHDAALVRLIFDYAAGDYRPNRGPT